MSASVAIDDSIRRLRSSGRSIREIKRLPRHESPKLSRLPKVYPCAVVAGPRNWRRRCWRWWSTRPSPNPDCPMSNWRPASQRGSASVSVLPWLRTRREAPLSLLEWDREHGQEAWDARITGNRPFSITKLDLLKIPEIRVHFTSLFQTGGNTIKKLLGHSPLKCNSDQKTC